MLELRQVVKNKVEGPSSRDRPFGAPKMVYQLFHTDKNATHRFSRHGTRVVFAVTATLELDFSTGNRRNEHFGGKYRC